LVSGAPPLDGVRVIDLTHYIAGPYCTKLLADYGADVIKIERPDGGDPARRLPPFWHDEPHLEGSGLFLHLNTNKKSLTLNLKGAPGRAVLLDLVREANILVESFSPRVMPQLSLDYKVLEATNPHLVMVSLSNFGQTGPYRDYKMSEITLYAMGGTMQSTGEQDREPVKLGLTVEQFFCGAMAASGVMGAFLGCALQGIGQHLDLSMYELMVGNQDRAFTALTTYQLTGDLLQRAGNAGAPSFSPVYPVADGFVQFFALQRVWNRVCLMMDLAELVDDPRFANPASTEAKETMNLILTNWLADRHKQEVMEQAQAVGLFCGALNTIEDVFKDPHLFARGFLVDIDHPRTGTLKYPGAPFILSDSPWRAGRAPFLGEHTNEILRGHLGYSEAKVALLRQQGAI
jgi:crotonobetainyl-CoA:carnitine CoA-transferase CaiB-like acyl-CoA transferase